MQQAETVPHLEGLADHACLLAAPGIAFTLDDSGASTFTVKTDPLMSVCRLSVTTSAFIDLLVVDAQQVPLDPGSTGSEPGKPLLLPLFGLGLPGLAGVVHGRRRR